MHGVQGYLSSRQAPSEAGAFMKNTTQSEQATLTTRPDESVSMPYPVWEYCARVAWLIIRWSVWLIAVRRIDFLRPAILRAFGARTSLKVGISGSCSIQRPWAVALERYSSIGPRVTIYNLGEFRLGSRSILSQDVYVCGGTHDYEEPSYPLLRPPVNIGDDVWVCAGAFIGPGVTIGNGAVVGARAVVTRDVPPWTVVAGNPAKEIRKRVLRQK